MRAVILIVVMGVNGASLALTARQWSQVFTNQMKHICSLYFSEQLLALASLRDCAGMRLYATLGRRQFSL